MPHQDRLNIAVFIDYDNIEIGVKNTLGQQFDVGTILEAIKERGEVVTKVAYADWTRAGEYSRSLTQHAIRLVQRNLTPGGDKNGADINLALDALEMAFTHPHINAYVIVGGDSDFLSLVEKLKQYDKKVFVVGGRAFTSVILQRNCHEFIAYENLAGVRRPTFKGGRPVAPPAAAPVAQAFPIVRRALKILAEREVSPQTGLLKSTLLQLDSTFSERNYGASSFFDFVDKLSKEGLVTLKHSGRSLMVELNEGFASEAVSNGVPAATDTASPPSAAGAAFPLAEEDAGFRPAGGPFPRPGPEMPPTESAGAGVLRARQIFAAASARWPMYLRNVKQILRQVEGGFDERRYGFGGLMDLLKACQREGVVRIERDHRGGLRVFQGHALQSPRVPSREPALPLDDPAEVFEVASVEVPAGESSAPAEPGQSHEPFAREESIEVERIEVEPIPIDTTANRLGRAQHRRPRATVLRQSPASVLRAAPRPARAKAPARKAAAPRKTGRSKKTAATDAAE